MTERRAVARQRCFLQGVLSFQNGTASEDGIVRNLSERGALIELPYPNAPERFDLLAPARGLRAAARVVWRIGARYGLALEPIAAAKPAARPGPRDEGY
jgi:hypothetical protein